MPIVNRVADMQPEITSWRRDFHAHPELQFDVHRTAASVAERLKSFGCDDVVTVEDYCTYMGELVGKPPIFEYTTETWCSLVPDTTFMHEVLGHCETTWRDGCRKLVEQCYPELLE